MKIIRLEYDVSNVPTHKNDDHAFQILHLLMNVHFIKFFPFEFDEHSEEFLYHIIY